MARVNRKTLKGYFRKGSLPSAENFTDLIDSLVHRDDLEGYSEPAKPPEPDDPVEPEEPDEPVEPEEPDEPVEPDEPEEPDEPSSSIYLMPGEDLVVEAEDPLLVLKEEGNLGLGVEDPYYKLQVAGWVGMEGRIGLYDPYAASDKTPKRFRHTVFADGEWHHIVPDVHGCFAFEIVAQVSGPSDSNKHAFTHAIAVNSFSARGKSIRQTQAYGGWYWRRKIKLKWKRQKRRWNDWSRHNIRYTLSIKTGYDYGVDENGKPIKIHYHITQLWGKPVAQDLKQLKSR